MSDYELWSELVFDAYYGVVSQLQILTWNFLQPLLQFGIVIFALVLNAIQSHIPSLATCVCSSMYIQLHSICEA